MVTMAPLLGLWVLLLVMIRSFAAVGGDIGAPTVITGGVSGSAGCHCNRAFSHRSISHPYSWCTDKVNSDIAKLEQKLGSMDLYIRESTTKRSSVGIQKNLPS